MLWIVLLQAGNVYSMYNHTESVHFVWMGATLTQPNPTRLFTFPFSSNFPFLFSFFSPHLSLYLPSLPYPPPTLPYPPLPQVSAYPALPCPIPAIRYNYLYPKKEKNKSQKTKKEKDYLSLQSVKSSIYHITITITHLFFGREGGEGGRGWGEEVLLYLQVPDLKDSDDDDECWRDDLSFHHSHGFFVWGRGRRGLLTCFACLPYTTYCSTELSGTAL